MVNVKFADKQYFIINEWNDLKTSQRRGIHQSIFEDKGSIDKTWFELYCDVFLIVLSVLSLPVKCLKRFVQVDILLAC